MKYLTIYRPYKVRELISKARSEKSGGYFVEAEAKDWDNALDKYAKEYSVIKCGTILSGENVLFWAMLEKLEKP